MALPIVNSSKYELKLPSGKTVKYRPFLVKEEKILLVANETGKQSDMVRATKEVLTACTFNEVNPSKLSLSDFEYLFLNIRGKSVGEVLKLKVMCPDDMKTYVDVDININDIKIPEQMKVDNVVEITDRIKVELRQPSIDDLSDVSETPTTTEMIDIVGKCISRVYDGETVYEDISKSDRETFLNSLTTSQFQKLSLYYETMPKVSHKVKVTNPKTSVESEVVLEGLNNFF